MRIALVLSLIVCLAGSIQAQSCSDLTVTGGTGTISFDVAGAPASSPTFLFVGDMTGSTSIGNFFTLGLGGSLAAAPLGVTDMNGDLSVSFNVPSVPNLAPLSLFGQTVSVDFGGGSFGTLTFCESDVEAFTLTF